MTATDQQHKEWKLHTAISTKQPSVVITKDATFEFFR